MSEITIDQNIDNIQTKLNNLTEGGESQAETSISSDLNLNGNNEKSKKSLLNSLISFPNIVAIILPILLIVLLIFLKPGFVMYIPDNSKPEEKKLSIQKCLLFGGVTGVVLGAALFFYLNNMKTKKEK